MFPPHVCECEGSSRWWRTLSYTPHAFGVRGGVGGVAPGIVICSPHTFASGGDVGVVWWRSLSYTPHVCEREGVSACGGRGQNTRILTWGCEAADSVRGKGRREDDSTTSPGCSPRVVPGAVGDENEE
ncbi:hypothetical protein BC826DRAFT_968708 [Russula brevipes]|nr:hypothetical protein BC826DRAFT_968708 [Russula brevipes]